MILLFLMVWIDLKTLKTLIPQKAFVCNGCKYFYLKNKTWIPQKDFVFNVFNGFNVWIDLETLKTLKTLETQRLQNPRFESCGIWFKNIEIINPKKWQEMNLIELKGHGKKQKVHGTKWTWKEIKGHERTLN